MKRHGETLNAYYRVKEAKMKRLHTIGNYMTFWRKQNYGDTAKPGRKGEG